MAKVYRAKNMRNHQLVALKIIDKRRLSLQEHVVAVRFDREAKLGCILHHPSIVRVSEYGEIADCFYMAMELVDGCDLAALLCFRKLEFHEVVFFMTCLLDALHFAHCNDVIHRDVKPANVLISYDGRVKLMDFGIAHIANSDLTLTGMILGSPSYMAPEQVNGLEVDARTDVFAAGSILYHMLTGNMAFRGAVPSVMYKVVHETPEFVDEQRVPASFVDIVYRAMAKKPEQRYQSALEFRNAIAKAWRSVTASTTTEIEPSGPNSYLSKVLERDKKTVPHLSDTIGYKILSESCRVLILYLRDSLPWKMVASSSRKEVANVSAVGHAPASSNLRPGDVFKDLSQPWCPTMVVLPPGSFQMGATAKERARALKTGTPSERVNRELPDHFVSIERPFAIGCFAVSFDEWDAWIECCDAQERVPDDRCWGRGCRPVVNVSWNDVRKYIAWLATETGKFYQLLSEAEWEYACRAGTKTAFAFGDDISFTQANFDDSLRGGSSQPEAFRRMTVPVDWFEPNAFGIYQMHGNVSEWVEDRWHETYQGAPSDGSAWTNGPDARRVLRGGSWNLDPGSKSSRMSAPELSRCPLQQYRLSRSAVAIAE